MFQILEPLDEQTLEEIFELHNCLVKCCLVSEVDFSKAIFLRSI